MQRSTQVDKTPSSSRPYGGLPKVQALLRRFRTATKWALRFPSANEGWIATATALDDC